MCVSPWYAMSDFSDEAIAEYVDEETLFAISKHFDCYIDELEVLWTESIVPPMRKYFDWTTHPTVEVFWLQGDTCLATVEAEGDCYIAEFIIIENEFIEINYWRKR